MVPDRKTDPLGYALWWLGDLVPVLHAKADAYRLELRSRDVPNVDRAAGLKRLKHLADHRGLLERLPYERRSCRSTVFVPVKFLDEYFMAQAAERDAKAAAKEGAQQG